MKNSIASIAFAVATFAMIGSASAQLVLSGNTDSDSAIEFAQIEPGQIDLGQIDLGLIEPGQIEPGLIEPALAVPAAVQKPVTVLPPATVTAPWGTPQTAVSYTHLTLPTIYSV